MGPVVFAQDGKSLIRAAYTKTKEAKTEADFTEIIDLCQQAKSSEISEKLKQYVNELLSWTFNRRGEIYATQAVSAQQSGQKDRADELDNLALGDFEQAVAMEPTRWKAIHNRGVSYALLGKYDEATKDFQRVITLKPDHANAWFNLGEIRFEIGKMEQAIRDYGEAIRLDPKDAVGVMRRGLAFSRLERFQEALKDFDRAIEMNENNADAYAHRGDTYQKLAKWKEAADDFLRASDLDKNSAHAYQSAAWLMATCPDEHYREPDLAIQAAEHALAVAEKEEPWYLDTLAAAYASAGRYDEAMETLNKAIETASDGPERDLLQQRLELYRNHKPYRQVPPKQE